MSIEKFFPQSPDPNLNVGPDMTLARFGHLNKLVDEINAGGGGGGGGGIIVEGTGANSSIRCGVDNQSFGEYGSALSGLANVTCNDFTANTWGRNNIAVGCYSSTNGTSNIVCARNSHILSGTNNTIACDAPTYYAFGNFTCSTYAGNYIQIYEIPVGYAGIACGKIYSANDLTPQWPVGSTFSVTNTYASGNTTSCSSCYSQFQMANVPVICSEYIAPYTWLYFCYDPASPSFIGKTSSCYTNGGGCCVTYSEGYIQKTGTFSDYSTYESSYHSNVIAGGSFNTIRGYTSASTISGGYLNTISGGYGTIASGCLNYMYNSYGFIGTGGRNLMCNASGGAIVAGYRNCMIDTSRAFIGNATFSCICSGDSNLILTGLFNTICNASSQASVINGCCSTISCSSHATILSGECHNISNACRGTIIAGFNNRITDGTNNMIMHGVNNNICGTGSFNRIFGAEASTINTTGYNNILFGINNVINGVNSNTIIGTNSGIPALTSNTVVLGDSITADRSCTTFVNNLSIKSIPTSSAGLPAGSVWNDAGTLKIV